MQISLEWLKDYIKIEADISKVSKLLTFSGIEVENVIPYGNIPETIVTVKIIDCELMKDSDHLRVCQVDTGSETLQVVCGAPNCRQGMVGVLALSGTKVGDLMIKNTRIRGVESCGMLCSEKELGLSDDHGGIIVLPEDTPLGITIREFFNLPDTLFELEITPNRPDLLGYLGVATDLAASIDGHVILPDMVNISDLESKDSPIADKLNLENLETDLCPRYTARVINNVKVSDSPVWLKQRLIKSGLRPINNIVDITNYVMLETGHPLHAFDYDKLQQEKGKPVIKVRRAHDKEAFQALDGKTYILDTEDLVIADATNSVALAGVIGGANSHITETTRNIVLEAAFFNHSSIRRTAYKHKISTDSSYRFERQLAAETTDIASIRAAQMIKEIAGGTLCEGSLDNWQKQDERAIVPFRPGRFYQIIGIKLSETEVINYLTKLGLRYLGEGSKIQPYPDSEEALYFEIPAKRVDLTREIDLIEEVIRLHGLEKIYALNKPALIMDRCSFSVQREVSDYLAYNGFQEIINLSFTDPELMSKLDLDSEDIRLQQIELLNPQNSNLSVMRTSLIPQLLLTANYNLNRGVEKLKMFEINKVYHENSKLPKQESLRLSLLCYGQNQENHWKYKSNLIDFNILKGLVEGLLAKFGLSEYNYNSQVSGFLQDDEALCIKIKDQVMAELGKLKPQIAAGFDIDTVELKQDIWIADIDVDMLISYSRASHKIYQPVPKFPSVQRDLSFLIQTEISNSAIFECIRQSIIDSFGGIGLIDQYVGKQIPDGFRSLTYRIVFNNPEKTLTDVEVDALIAIIVNNLKNKWNIQLR